MTDLTARAVTLVAQGGLASAELSESHRHWAEANGFNGQSGRLLALPADDGDVAGYLFGIGAEADRQPLIVGAAAAQLAPGRYRLAGQIDDPTLAALAFRLGGYRFTRYRKLDDAPELELPENADAAEVDRLVEAAFIARDLINTPANDLGPDALEEYARAQAARDDMQVRVTRGDDLVGAGFPMIHAVGRAAGQAPRLIDLTWGSEDAPKVTLVGKGVTFDTGGLDIKPAAGMVLMKKDMGGAANVLGLAHAIVRAKLNVRLRVLLPVVENAISANAFRPSDILMSRKGITVEIGNTDAEGRLILADALALACEEDPALVIDMATLTGAARAALGPDLPPLYTGDDTLAAALMAAGTPHGDPLWHMPLWTPYEAMLASKVADINNAGAGGFAGSVTAALFLRRFVEKPENWVHLDIYGWSPDAKPGRSAGGTDQGIRAVYQVLKQRYA
ncbi:leucyl aminopeptidase [Devosia pacifica]|uniref:Leucyl aminopeptidase n=2 Tax=Devosia pacifica TaxID=1335967 RepID=A0A918SB18_9HYPH|nr:leucyl aminopeptidase family protein [Devosia pacifica]GHA31886.1 leucyl aminopeptidase [Devosia pacifica]